MTRLVGSVGLLVAVYALTLASFHPWDLAGGALVAGATLAAFRAVLPRGASLSPAALLRRVVAFVPFAVVVVRNIVVGTWNVAGVVLHLRPLDHPGIVAVPIGERSRVGVAVSALADTLSPGSFLVDVDWAEGVMLIHVLDASDPDEIRAAHHHLYHRWQRHVFP